MRIVKDVVWIQQFYFHVATVEKHTGAQTGMWIFPVVLFVVIKHWKSPK